MIGAFLILILGQADGGLLARPVQVTADHLEVLNREGKAIYTGHAHAIRDQTDVKCRVLTVFYGKDKAVTRIDAQDDVEAFEGERHAWGEVAHFDNTTGLLEVLGHPKVQSGTKQVVGERVVFTSGSDQLEVDEPHTLAQQTGGDQVEIEAHHLTLRDKVSEATWRGEVKAKKKDTLLKAPELTAHYDDKGEVTRITAHGGVEVFQRDRWAKGKNLDYDVKKGELVVTGNPQAREGTHRMKGSRVTFWSNPDRLEVNDAITVFENATAPDGGTPKKEHR